MSISLHQTRNISAARRKFLRQREDLRRVRERFAGELTLLSARPLAVVSRADVAQGIIPSRGR